MIILKLSVNFYIFNYKTFNLQFIKTIELYILSIPKL